MICAFYWKGNEKYDALLLILLALGEKSLLYQIEWQRFYIFLSRVLALHVALCARKGAETTKWKDLNAFCLSRAGREKFNSRPPMTDSTSKSS